MKAFVWALAGLLSWPLAGCVSIDLPGLVTDTAKVGKDAYRSIAGKKDEEKPKDAGADPGEYITHSTVGLASQTVAEIREQCVREAVQKLNQLSGKDVPFTVLENTVSSVSTHIVGHCKVAVAKPPAVVTENK